MEPNFPVLMHLSGDFTMRKLLPVSFLAALVFSVGSVETAKAEAPNPAMVACAKTCGECAMTCDQCAAYCVTALAEGKKEHLKSQRLCQDCAAICGTATCIMARSGPLSDVICNACADACKRCGDCCEAIPGDEMMKKCAEECRKCETACRAMLKVNAGTK